MTAAHLRKIWPLVLLATAATLAWAPAMRGGFVWLDRVEIQEEGYLARNADDLAKLWTWGLGAYLERDSVAEPIEQGAYFRPVYATWNSVSRLLWGDVAWLWHLEAIAWHVGAVLLMYLLGMGLRPPEGPAAASWGFVIFAATLCFAVHPLGEQSVAWISGRKDTMCVVFALLASHAFLSFASGPRQWDRAPWLVAVGAIVALFAAIGCKELALVVPALLTGCWITGVLGKVSGHRAGVLLGLMWAVALGAYGYRASVLGGFGLGAPAPETDLLGRIAMSVSVGADYFGRIFLPRAGLLSDAWPIAVARVWVVAVPVVLMIGALLFVKWRATRFPLLWVAVWFLPASGVVALWHFRAERYLYPASWGGWLLIFLAVAVVIRRFVGDEANRGRWQAAAAVLPAAGMIVVTWGALPRWQSDAALFGDAAARDPHHAEARLVLGEAALREGRNEEAVDQLRTALAISLKGTHAVYLPPFIARSNLGIGLYRSGRIAEAREVFEKAVADRPGNARAHYHVGLAALAAGELGRAETSLREGLRLAPEDIPLRANYAVLLMQGGDLDGAIAAYARLMDEGWEEVQGMRNFGSLLLARKRFEEAAPFLAKVMAAEPADALSQAKLAWCYAALGRKDEARELLEQALTAAPGDGIVAKIAGTVATLLAEP